MGNSGGSWLPEEKKANMWHGRGNSGGSWPPAFPRSSDWIVPFMQPLHSSYGPRAKLGLQAVKPKEVNIKSRHWD